MRIAWFWVSLVAGWSWLASVGCTHTPTRGPEQKAGTPRTYSARGIIREIDSQARTLRVSHEAIPGYMAAMTMNFEVREGQWLQGLAVGDRITFRLNVTPSDGWIDQITVIESGQARPGGESVRITRVVKDLNEGDVMPDYRFTNELGKAVSLHQFKGEALAITFIYTSCPYPTFCPRMSANFAQTYRQLTTGKAQPANWHLLSITFDPGRDTPAVLQGYAKSYGYDRRKWSFLTGAMIDIDAITEQFGLFFARDGEGFSHNVRTVVIDAGGRIQKIFRGNKWQPEELAAELRSAASKR